MSCRDPDHSEKTQEDFVIPQKVSCRCEVSQSHVTFRLRVEVTNPFNATTSCVVAVPKVSGSILLEEAHECAGVCYTPRVMEKKHAEQSFEQASRSAIHSATLSGATDDAHEVKMDKIPAGAAATFNITFLQPLRSHGKVVQDADEPQ